MASICITMQEVLDIVRKHFGVSDTMQIDIVEEKEVSDCDWINNEWFNVPSDWRHEFAPSRAEAMPHIQIKRRNGATESGKPDDWASTWSQDNYSGDIVAYREIKE